MFLFLQALSFPIQSEAGHCLAVVNFFAQKHVEESETHLQAIETLAASSAPYIEHMASNRKRTEPDKSLHDVTMSSEGASRFLDTSASSPARKPRTTIRYKAPTTSSPKPSSPDPHGLKFEPKVLNREAPISYIVNLTKGFLKYPKNEDGTPNVFRVSLAWQVLEQLCDTAGSFSECLSMIKDELKPALYSDDLMSADDGTTLIRIPFFAQLDYRKGQVADALNAVERVQESKVALEAELEQLKELVAQSQAEMGKLHRKVFLANRKVIKKNLSTFLERRQMAADAKAELQEEMETMTTNLQNLEVRLNDALEGNKRDIFENKEELAQMKVSLGKCGVLRPPMEPALVVPPVPHTRIHGPHLPIITFEEEVLELKNQLLMLRNANLSSFEARFSAGVQQDHSEFKMNMEELELEIQALDAAIQRGLAPNQYELVITQPGQETGSVGSHESPLPDKSPARRLDDISKEPLSEQQQEEEKEQQYWLEKGSNQQIAINVWKLWEKRKTTAREMPRKLDIKDVTQWVYAVYQKKANADVRSQKDSTVALLTVEQTLFQYLDEKYMSRHVANIVAYDILILVEEMRETSSLFSLFAQALSGGWFDANWKYILRVQQFANSLYPNGFNNLSELEDFLVRYFYNEHPHTEVERVIKALQIFAPYNRQLAEAASTQAGEKVTAELLAELVAHMLEQGEEPRLQKIKIMMDLKDMVKRAPVSYEEFEQFADLCVPTQLDVATCRLYYRMLLKSHPDRLFPPASLAMCVVTLELEMLLSHHSFSQELVIGNHAQKIAPPPAAESSDEDNAGPKVRRSMRRTSVVTFNMIADKQDTDAAGVI